MWPRRTQVSKLLQYSVDDSVIALRVISGPCFTDSYNQVSRGQACSPNWLRSYLVLHIYSAVSLCTHSTQVCIATLTKLVCLPPFRQQSFPVYIYFWYLVVDFVFTSWMARFKLNLHYPAFSASILGTITPQKASFYRRLSYHGSNSGTSGMTRASNSPSDFDPEEVLSNPLNRKNAVTPVDGILYRFLVL